MESRSTRKPRCPSTRSRPPRSGLWWCWCVRRRRNPQWRQQEPVQTQKCKSSWTDASGFGETVGRRGSELYHADAVEIIAQRLARAAKRQRSPRELVRREEPRLEAFLVAAELATQRRRGVYDDDHRGFGIRVDVHQAVEADLESRFFPRFADGRLRQLFASVDKPSGEHPEPVSRLDRAAHEHEPRIRRGDDRADRDFRIEVEDEPPPAP